MPISFDLERNRRKTIHIPQAECEWRVCFDGNAVILRCSQRKNIKRRCEPRTKPLKSASNSALQCASWEYHSHKHTARRSNNDDLRAVCFKLRVAFIYSDINSFCNIHIGSKTKKKKRFGKTKNDKLQNAQREGRCLTLARIGFANKISTPRLESAELEAGSKG